MITKDNSVRLIDFGLSEKLANQKTLKASAGTPYLLSSSESSSYTSEEDNKVSEAFWWFK